MQVLTKSDWEKVLSLPREVLSSELQKVITKNRKVIEAYLKGEKIQFLSNDGWSNIYVPSFDNNYQYRVYQPTMDFQLTLEKDEADALRRALSGFGLNSQERMVVTAVADKFQKQFDAVFSREGNTSKTNQPCDVASL